MGIRAAVSYATLMLCDVSTTPREDFDGTRRAVHSDEARQLVPFGAAEFKRHRGVCRNVGMEASRKL